MVGGPLEKRVSGSTASRNKLLGGGVGRESGSLEEHYLVIIPILYFGFCVPGIVLCDLRALCPFNAHSPIRWILLSLFYI